MLWDLAEGKRLYQLDAGDIIHALTFSPNRYWLCAATSTSIKIWDLESKSVVDDLRPEFPRTVRLEVERWCLGFGGEDARLCVCVCGRCVVVCRQRRRG